METLSDLLAGNQGQGGGLQQTGAQDPGYEQRKTGWKQSLDAMIQDPVNAMMMLQFGSSLANIQPGQNVGAAVANAFTDTFAMRGRYEQILRDRQAAEQEAAMKSERLDMDKQRIGFEGERIGVARDQMAQDKETRDADRELKKEELRIRREQLKAERERGAAGQSAKPSEIDKLTLALVQEHRIPESRARVLANQMAKGNTREERILDVTKELLLFHDNIEAAQAEATQIVDGIFGATNPQLPAAQVTMPSGGDHPGWSGISPQRRAEMESMARSDPNGQVNLIEYLNLRAEKLGK